MRYCKILLFFVFLSFHISTYSQSQSWIAYNDSANKNGGTSEETVTEINIGRSSPGPNSGELLQYGSGEGTGVTATYKETLSVGSVFWTSDSITYDEESDAARIFSEVLDLTGNISYGDAPGWYMDLEIEGLDPDRKYTFVGTAMRGGGAGYAERTTNWKIIDADKYTYASSSGAWKVGEDSVEFSTGHNEVGYVAKWTDISPGEDGKIIIRTSHSVGEENGGLPGAHSYKGYAGGVFMLESQADVDEVDIEDDISIVRVFPRENQSELQPKCPIEITIQQSNSLINQDSVNLLINGEDVEPIIDLNTDEIIIRYYPLIPFESNSTNTVKLNFEDTSISPRKYLKEWKFSVMDISIYDVLVVDPIDIENKNEGFAIRVVATNTDEQNPDNEILNDISDLWWIWDEQYFNYAEKKYENKKGYFIEYDQVNYQRDMGAIGNKANEKMFPGILGSDSLIPNGYETPVVNFGLEITTFLELESGFNQFEITTTPYHKLYIGFGDDAEELIPDPSVNPGTGDSRAWQYKFIIENTGIYPFTLHYLDSLSGSSSLTASGGSASSLEWISVSPEGKKFLINQNNPKAINAFIPDYAFVKPASLPLINYSINKDKDIKITFNGILQQANSVNGPWIDTISESPKTVSFAEILLEQHTAKHGGFGIRTWSAEKGNLKSFDETKGQYEILSPAEFAERFDLDYPIKQFYRARLNE